MIRKTVLASLVVVGLGVAYADDKVAKDQGTARARFAWDKLDGALDQNRLSRTVEGPGVGAVEIDSASAAWVGFDPERTTAGAILQKLKDTRSYEAARLTTVVSMYLSPDGWTVTASASAKGAKGSAKRRGELLVRAEALPGVTVEMDAKAGKPHGRFKPGVVLKAPREVDLDKAVGPVVRSGTAETYIHGLNLKKGGEDSVITVTVNVVAKDKNGKETLHSVELPVAVQASN